MQRWFGISQINEGRKVSFVAIITPTLLYGQNKAQGFTRSVFVILPPYLFGKWWLNLGSTFYIGSFASFVLEKTTKKERERWFNYSTQNTKRRRWWNHVPRPPRKKIPILGRFNFRAAIGFFVLPSGQSNDSIYFIMVCFVWNPSPLELRREIGWILYELTGYKGLKNLISTSPFPEPIQLKLVLVITKIARPLHSLLKENPGSTFKRRSKIAL